MTTELTFAALIFSVLLALAIYFGRQQVQALRTPSELPDEDRRYVRRQAWLRLFGCFLLVLLGAQVGGAYLFGLEGRIRELAEQIDEQYRRDGTVVLNEEQRELRRLYGIYWIAALVVLLAIVFLAAFDIWAIRRYGRRHRLKIDAERRAMLEGQVARFRAQRNGHA
ncbi:MAG: hypothetical protein K2R98_29670 [Gemmataceae bacterium]|nr:hypothetical protein [Gemmataceae bacterium]